LGQYYVAEEVCWHYREYFEGCVRYWDGRSEW
jgi:hypothetical protein